MQYGPAVSDLACALLPWWPRELVLAHAGRIVRQWHETLDMPDYGWDRAWSDWLPGVGLCLRVPVFWCTNPQPLHGMRGLWQTQLEPILACESAVAAS